MRPTLRWGLAIVVVVAAICGVAAPAAAQSETVEYYGLDAVGSVRIVFDANGNILGRMDYTPFGQELFGGTNMPDRRYAGLFRDGEAGLDHAGARSYQLSRTGRFSTVDPIYAGLFEPQRWNRYGYALSSPIVFSDPTGLDADCQQRGEEGRIHCTETVTVKPTGIISAARPSPVFGAIEVQGHFEIRIGQGNSGGGASMSAPRPRSWMTSTTPPSVAAAEAAIIAASVQPTTVSAAPVQTPTQAQAQGDQQIAQIARTVWSTAAPMTQPGTYVAIYGVAATPGLVVTYGPLGLTVAGNIPLTSALIQAGQEFVEGMAPGPPPPSWAGYAGSLVGPYVEEYILPKFRRR